MAEMVDKRKHFRFPAFDDKEGVKLEKTNRRVLFEGEFDSIFDSEKGRSKNDEPTYEEKYFAEEKDIGNDSMHRVDPRSAVQKSTVVQDRKLQPKKNKYAYQGPPIEDKFKEVKKPVFYSEHRASLEKKQAVEKKNDFHKNTYTQPGKYQGRSHFVPKHIPASVTPEERDSLFTKEEIFKEMDKSRSTYMVLDMEENKPFKERTIEKKEITPFETKQEEVEIPFTRREYKKGQKNSVNKKQQDIDTPAVQKKQIEKDNNHGRSSRLEKSLSGIMEEEQSQLKSNKYFY